MRKKKTNICYTHKHTHTKQNEEEILMTVPNPCFSIMVVADICNYILYSLRTSFVFSIPPSKRCNVHIKMISLTV